jgi:hypothetical protein
MLLAVAVAVGLQLDVEVVLVEEVVEHPRLLEVTAI